MTLIIGVFCSDGVAMVADAGATLTRGRDFTASDTLRKLHRLAGGTIVGAAGSVGLMQLVRRRFEILESELRTLEPIDALQRIQNDLLSTVIQPARERAQACQQLTGTAALEDSCCEVLTAMWHESKHKFGLYHCDQLMSADLVDDLPYSCIGGGQKQADPLMAFARRVLWAKKQPTMRHAVLTMVWAMQHVIETSPDGIREPIQVMTLRDDDNSSRELNDASASLHQILQPFEEDIRERFHKLSESPLAIL